MIKTIIFTQEMNSEVCFMPDRIVVQSKHLCAIALGSSDNKQFSHFRFSFVNSKITTDHRMKLEHTAGAYLLEQIAIRNDEFINLDYFKNKSLDQVIDYFTKGENK